MSFNNQELKIWVLQAVVNLQKAVHEQKETAVALSEFIQITSFLPITKLERWEAWLRSPLHCLRRFSLQKTVQSNWPPFTNSSNISPWLDLCSGNGFKREEVLIGIKSDAPNAFLFALVLRRLNDWVPAVCDAARRQVPIIATQTRPEYVVDALWGILSHLSSWGRISKQELEVLLNLLYLPDIAPLISKRIQERPAGPVASIMSQIGRISVLDNDLFDIAENAIQPAVRAKAYRYLLEKKVVWLEGRRWQWSDQYFRDGKYKAVLGTRVVMHK
ncbi:hypothetical protein Lepto7376_3084 [[Leptolyngbya] sp. PCC 7376]|uniref:hypothetical protein n=1 Tax=[Leptolyngbya] sp. PCC 7376 TaxID=111781 RepID=UPI00029EDD53|nr:hypothetical protein [[Leptolyngbya] sp. PCC 7376]AFY39323.1 hypothetical protein Lepto7376_3084 [[Leptolyngbya] sp. PCC 7376]